MPEHKQPNKLYKMCLKVLNQVLDNSCDVILRTFGPYSNKKTQAAVMDVQKHLARIVPVPILDELFNMRKNGGSFVNSTCCGPKNEFRILLALIMHENMKTFRLSYLEVPMSVSCKIDESFWMIRLSLMNRLVVLDLSLVCTDGILEVVGRSCPLLQDVTVVSKMSKTSKGGTFNALKKMYHVTDKGLRHLVQCRHLQRISLNSTKRSGLGHITEAGICRLVSALPDLKVINYEYMGSVLRNLPERNPPLGLEELTDLRTHPSNLSLYERYCPQLVHLFLALPTNLCPEEVKQQSEVIVRRFLTESSVKLETLNIAFVEFPRASFVSFLEAKGSRLTKICFGLGCSEMNCESLITLGRFCPNINDLTILTMGPDLDVRSEMSFKKEAAYTKLNFLVLIGISEWDASRALSICVRNSVTSLYLSGPQRSTLDIRMTQLLYLNHLQNLKTLTLRSGCLMSVQTVWMLVHKCPQLSQLHCLEHRYFTDDDVRKLLEYVADNNYALVVKVLDGSQPWH